MRRISLLFAAVLATVSAVAGPAAASALPTVMASTTCAHPCTHTVGVYKVRPGKIELSEAAGGTLKLHWSRWGAVSATGGGTSFAGFAGGYSTSDVTVTLSRPRGGTFTAMTINFTHVQTHDQSTGQVTAGHNAVERLTLTQGSDPLWNQS